MFTITKNAHAHSNLRKNNTTLALYALYFSLVPCVAVPLMTRMEVKRKYCERMQYLARLRKPRKRRSWSDETERFTDRMFVRLFRMERQCFDELLVGIEDAVGAREFKSEHYLRELEMEGTSTPLG